MNRALRRGLLIGSIIWLILGLAAISVYLHIESGVGDDALIYPAIPLYLLSSGFGTWHSTSGLLWDSAHGPPFLTLTGVAVVYFLPSVLGFIAFVRKRSTRASSGDKR
jgi:hypothetical protein